MNDVRRRAEQRLLLFSIFIISLCGITYELVLGSLATYLLGNPVMQYSITIGFFLSTMGLGSYLSRFIVRDVLRTFIMIEVALGLAGGLSVLTINYFFSFTFSFYLLHVLFVSIIGILVGFEIPLLARHMKRYGPFKNVISNVLSIDYLGGLAGSLLFPLLLFPFLGRFLASILIGIFNIAVAVALVVGVAYPGKKRSDILLPLIAVLMLAACAFLSGEIDHILQKRLYADDIVFSRRSKYQEIVLTRNEDDFRLYLDGSLQFSTYDEYRYHEMLVFPALAQCRAAEKRVLVLGGGDGLAVREILKHQGVRSVILVELDPEMVHLARGNASFRKINGDSLRDPRVRVVVCDAYEYLTRSGTLSDLVVADFSDPHDETISKLYTVEFFRLVKRTLAPGGIFVCQSTSPLFAREAFWCINKSMRQVFPYVVPYHIYVPTFGDWGFNLASTGGLDYSRPDEGIPAARYFSSESFKQSLYFPADCKAIDTRINTFDRPVLYSYYLKGWKYID